MPSKYIPLLTLSWEHEYYLDGTLRGLSLHPLPATATLIRNYRLLLKQQAAQYRLLQETRPAGDENTPVIGIEKDIDLAFGFLANDALFQVKTGIDFFSSNKKKIVLDLRSGENPPAIQLLDLAKGGLRFVQENPDDKTAVLYDRNGGELERFTADAHTGVFSIDLENYPDDIYAIRVNEGTERRFLLLHQDAGFDGIVLAHLAQREQNVTIKFPARHLFWEYIVVTKYDNYEELNMVEESGKIDFEKAVHPSIEKGFSFTTAKPVTLSERYEYNFQLEDQGRVVKKNIASGDLKSVGMCLINVHNFCLKNYVSV